MAIGILFKNNAASTLAGNLGGTAADLSFDVAAGHGSLFPAPTGSEYFYVTLVDSSGNREVLKIEDVTSDTFTVTAGGRGQDSTTIRAFVIGDIVELRLTQGSLEDIVDAVDTDVTGLATHIADTTPHDAYVYTETEIDTLCVKKATLTTKGDIYAATAASTPARLPVGVADGYVLSVKASESTGLKWIIGSDVGFAAGTVILFGQASAPTGWTKKVDWADNSMLCINSEANGTALGAGGSVNPQSAHAHTISHTHSLSAHTHSGTTDNNTGAVTRSSGAVNTAAFQHSHTFETDVPSSDITGAVSTANSGNNSLPLYQEIIAATKD